jgi:hypothetical protein
MVIVSPGIVEEETFSSAAAMTRAGVGLKSKGS